MGNNPKDYIVVKDVELAHKLKKENPECILIGERDGFELPGFDYCNSPTELNNKDFSGKTVVQTTTLGTKGIVGALEHTDKVITGSFVNTQAIINYIKKGNLSIVYLFCTDGRDNDNEDLMFAKYIKGYFENKVLDIRTIKQDLTKHEFGINYLVNPRTKYSKTDFSLALQLNKFNFILKAHKNSDELIHLKKIT